MLRTSRWTRARARSELIDFIAIEDIGRVLNPLIVHGQALGAIVQGLGGTFMEHLRYDEDGQLLTASFADYLLPTATDFPAIRGDFMELALAPGNPLGVKGAGEGGIVAVAAAVTNAVSAALSSFGVQVLNLPISPPNVWQLIRSSQNEASMNDERRRTMKLRILSAPDVAFALRDVDLSRSGQPDFPNRTVRILVGFAPGGTTDLLARIIADELRSMWNTAVVVENRPGADGIVATTALHNAPGDGYTLLMSTNALVITPHLKPLPYDPIKDFEPITIVGQEYHHMLVTPRLAGEDGQGVHRAGEVDSWRADLLVRRSRQRAIPGHAALLAGCRNYKHGPRSLSWLDAGRHGARDIGRSIDVFIAIDDAAAFERRQDPRARGRGSKARPQRSRRADLGGVGSRRALRATPGSPWWRLPRSRPTF